MRTIVANIGLFYLLVAAGYYDAVTDKTMSRKARFARAVSAITWPLSFGAMIGSSFSDAMKEADKDLEK